MTPFYKMSVLNLHFHLLQSHLHSCATFITLCLWSERMLYLRHYWRIVPAPDDRWWWLLSIWWNEDWQGKPRYSEETCPRVTVSTTNPTWPYSGSNPGRRGGKPATNRLSYGAAFFSFYLFFYLSIYVSVYLSIYLWLYSPFVGSWPLFQFLNSIHRQ
jgi:hypothetical protein